MNDKKGCLTVYCGQYDSLGGGVGGGESYMDTLTCDVWSVCEECEGILVLLIATKINSMPSLKKPI